MELSTIREISSAFLVGMIALVAIETMLYSIVSWSPTGLFPIPGVRSPKGSRLALYVALATVVGLLAETSFQSLISDASGPVAAIPNLVSSICDNILDNASSCPPRAMPQEDLRLSALYSIKANDNLKPARLLTELVHSQLIFRHCGGAQSQANTPAFVEQTVLQDLSRVPPESDTSAAGSEWSYRECLIQLFYEGKNWAYMQPELYEELKNFESRIDFSSALWLVTISLVPWIVVFILCALAGQVFEVTAATVIAGTVLQQASKWTKKLGFGALGVLLAVGAVVAMGVLDGILFGGEGSMVFMAYVLGIFAVCVCGAGVFIIRRVLQKNWQTVRHALGVSAALCAALITLHILGYYSYAQEMKEYAKRVYGYYETYNVLQTVSGRGTEQDEMAPLTSREQVAGRGGKAVPTH